MVGLNDPVIILFSLLLVVGFARATNLLFSHLHAQLLMNVWTATLISWIAIQMVYYFAEFVMASIGIPIDFTINLRSVTPIEIWAYLAGTFLFCFVFYLSFEITKKAEIRKELEKKKEAAEATK